MEEVVGSTPPGDVVRLALRVASLPPHSSIEKLLDTANDAFERLALTKVEHVWTGRGKEEFFNVKDQLIRKVSFTPTNAQSARAPKRYVSRIHPFHNAGAQ